jgi:transposase
MEFEVIQPGPGRLIRAMMDEIELIPIINSSVRWDETQWKLSPGELIAAMLISCFCRRQAMYKLEKFYQYQDLELLFGRNDINGNDFTDDSLGRALDRFAEQCEKIFGAIILKAREVHHLVYDIIHTDTTSITVYGEYDFPDAEEPLIALGFSKDHRPDLKQYMTGLGVNSEGVPALGKTLKGNTSDKEWNKRLFTAFHAGLADYAHSIIVADSQAITIPNLKLAKGIAFVSRLPDTFALNEQLKQRAWANNSWIELGRLAEAKKSATYRIQGFVDQIDGENYRFVVVHSSSLDKAKEKSIQKGIAKEFEHLKKEFARLEKTEFACEPDARLAFEQLLKTVHPKYHCAAMTVVPQEVAQKRSSRGRPPVGVLPDYKTVWRVVCQLELDTAAVAQTYNNARTFVLISSVPDQRASDAELLKIYKDQPKVETRFKFLKDPYYVGAVFFKMPERIEAFNYVLLLALLLYSLLERRVRQSLVAEKEPFHVAGSYKTYRPSGKTILESLDYISIGVFRDSMGGRREIPANIERALGRLVRLAGFEIGIYTRPPCPVLRDG